MGAVVLASVAPIAYVIGFAIFKTSATRMPALTGARPFSTAWQLALSPLWLAGLVTLIAGLAVQSMVLTELPVSAVVPMYGPIMFILLLVAVSDFGERVAGEERRALGVLLLALLAFAAAGGLLQGQVPADAGAWSAPLWKVLVVVVPSVLIPLWFFTIGDRPLDGRHAKQVTGVAYGLGAGVVVGCAESSGAAIARIVEGGSWQVSTLLASPHPYVVVVTGLLGAAFAQIGLQRCRLSVVIIVLAIGSKASLWLSGILAYGQPWPEMPGPFLLSGVGLVLATWSLFLIPRHEPDAPLDDASEEPETAPGPEILGDTAPPFPRPVYRPAMPLSAPPMLPPDTPPGPRPGTPERNGHAGEDPSTRSGLKQPVWRLP